MSGGRRGGNLLSKDQLLFWSLWFGVPAVILGFSSVTSNALALAVDLAPRVLGLIVAGALGWWLGARLAKRVGRPATAYPWVYYSADGGSTWVAKRVGRPATAYPVTAALALALVAWVFIPTLHGRAPATVVSGTRRIASALRAVDASDLEGFNRTSAARGTIGACQFPTLRAWSDHQLDAAERSWAEKVADDLGARLRALAPGDLDGYKAVAADPRLRTAVGRGLEGRIDGFSAWGERAATDLAATLGKVRPGDVEGFLLGRRDREKFRGAVPARASIVSKAEEAWVVESVEALEAEVEPLLSSDPKRVSERAVRALADLERCGATREVLSRVDQLRRKAFSAGLEQAKREALALVKDKKYEAASASAARFQAKWAGEAAAVGSSDVVERFAEGYAFLADLARIAMRPDPK